MKIFVDFHALALGSRRDERIDVAFLQAALHDVGRATGNRRGEDVLVEHIEQVHGCKSPLTVAHLVVEHPQQAIVAADRVDPAPAKNQTVLLEDEPVMPRATLTLGDSVYDIDKARFAIGRDAGDLIIAGDHVSHEHCEITFTNGTFCVTDLKSSNHTYVNGTMIAPYEPKALADGDAIRFADIDAIFHVG